MLVEGMVEPRGPHDDVAVPVASTIDWPLWSMKRIGHIDVYAKEGPTGIGRRRSSWVCIHP